MFLHMLIICQGLLWHVCSTLEGFLVLLISAIGTATYTQAQTWRMRHTGANPQSIRHHIHFIYLFFRFVHRDSPPLEHDSRGNGTFSTILIFPFVLQELLAQNIKWDHVGECGRVVFFFMWEFSDRRCAAQWIYKGTSAFKNIRKETFPTQRDQLKPKVCNAQTASGCGVAQQCVSANLLFYVFSEVCDFPLWILLLLHLSWLLSS